MKSKPRSLLATLLAAAVAVGIVPANAAAAEDGKTKPSVTLAEGTVIVEGDRYRMTVDVREEVAITSLLVDGTEFLQDGGLIHTAVKVEGAWSGSLAPTSAPVVDVSNQKVTIEYETDYTAERWEIKAKKERADVTFEKTYKGNFTVEEQGFPMMKYGQDIVENIRWSRSGGNFWVGGKGGAMRRFLSGGSGYLAGDDYYANIRRAMEDTSFTLLTGYDARAALRISGSTNREGMTLPAAIEVDRVLGPGEKKLLMLGYNVAAPSDDLHYATGSSADFMEGWPDSDQKQGHVRPTGQPIYAPVTVSSGQVDRVKLDFEPADYDAYYDLGTLNGVDERLLSEALNNYGRLMVLDYRYGTAQENPNVFFEVPAIQQHWNVALGTITRDDGVIETLKNGLRNVRDGAQAPDGHITSPYVWQRGDAWGSDYGDMGLGYVLGIADLYAYTNDKSWAEEMRESVHKALAYERSFYLDESVYLLKNVHPYNPALRETHNDYWEKSVGKYNGYTTVMYYDALMSWAAVERIAFNDHAKASEYEQLALRVKEALNRSFDEGGMWSEDIGAIMYGSDNLELAYLPPNGAALRSGLLSAERARKLVDRIERDNANFNLGFHVMNVRDLRDESVPAPQDDNHVNTMLGENGGWYGAPDADFYAGFPVYGDREKIPYYINRFTHYFNQTGFVNGTTWKRDGVTPQDYGWHQSMPDQVLPVWALYTYAYGFQPEAGRLVLAPFISESMVGSEVLYRWAGKDMSVTYEGLYAYKVTLDELPGDIVVRFVNQTPSAIYQVRSNDHIVEVQADANGFVELALTDAGTHRVELVNPDAENFDAAGNAAFGKPVRASSTLAVDSVTAHWAEQITDGDLRNGAWFAADAGSPSWVVVDIGRKVAPEAIKLYFGRSDRYTLTLEATNDRDGSWTQIAAAAEAEAGPQSPLAFEANAGAYQYWRVNFLQTASGGKANLRELEIGQVTPEAPVGAAEEPEYMVPVVVAPLPSTVTVSSSLTDDPNSNWHANKVNDGIRTADHISAGWSSAAGAPTREEWVQLDLGGVHEIGEIALFPRSDAFEPGNYFPLDYQVLISEDGTQWSTIANVTDQPLTTQAVTFTFEPAHARYVKVLATRMRDVNGNAYYVQISEIEVRPPSAAGPVSDFTRNVAVNKPVRVSTELSWAANWLGAKAVDGLRTSDGASAGWSSYVGPEHREEWLQVDLEETYDIKELRLYPRSDSAYAAYFPVDYRLQLSEDGTHWTDVAVAEDTERPYTVLKYPMPEGTKARFVRLLVTQFRADSPDYFVQLAELEVWARGPVAD